MSRRAHNFLATSVLNWRPYALLAIFVSALHTWVWLSAWGYAFARAEFYGASRPVDSDSVDELVQILGAPLMYLPERWFLAVRPFVGGDSAVLVLQAVVNGSLWGLAFAGVAYFLRSRFKRVSLRSNSG
jgi:hypothetical protein